MPKNIEYRYILYDENGVHYTTVFGTSNKAVIQDLRSKGWTSIGFGKAKLNTNVIVREGEYINKAYGRDRTKENRMEQFRHLYVVRQQLTTISYDDGTFAMNLSTGNVRKLLGLEYVPFRRLDLIGI